MTATTNKQIAPLAEVRMDVDKMEGQFSAALPAHIPVERFKRVVMTAIGGNPDLLNADRASLFESSLKAAQDGLLPDGRDGALVVYNVKVKGKDGERDRYIKKVQWMPMIAGILKKVRNSGELVSIGAHVAYEKDSFFWRQGDDEQIEHTPYIDGDRGKPRLAYAIAKTKDGGIYREVMTFAEIEQVRAVSRAKDSGPWTQWWGEMARKTVLRRLAKRLPMSSDLDDLIRRDDALYDFDSAREEAKKLPARGTLSDRMAALSAPKSGGQTRQIDHDPETGEIHDDQQDRDEPPVAKGAGAKRPPQDKKAPAPAQDDDRARRAADPVAEEDVDGDFPGDPVRIAGAEKRGEQDARNGISRRRVPEEYRDYDALAEAWERGHDRASAEASGEG